MEEKLLKSMGCLYKLEQGKCVKYTIARRKGTLKWHMHSKNKICVYIISENHHPEFLNKKKKEPQKWNFF